MEAHSQHSIAQGIVNEAKKKGISIPEIKEFKSFPGKGAVGNIGGKKVVVGNRILMEELKVDMGDGSSTEELKMGKTANTPIFVAVDNKLAGIILLADIIREESKEAVKRLHYMGIKTAMLTGDTQDVANEVGKQLDMDTVFAQVLPGDKVNKVKELQNKGNVTLIR